MYSPFLTSALKKCETGQAVDDVFEKRKIIDYKKRILCLCHCMRNPQVFFGGKEKENSEEELRSKYVTMRAMFVTGSWR